MSWWQRKHSMEGVAFVRGTLPPRWEEFTAELPPKVVATSLPTDSRTAWAARVTHPQWGTAEVRCLKSTPKLPPTLLTYSMELTKQERDAFLTGSGFLLLTMPSQRDHVLGDRKNFLRMARMVIGDDGVGVVDRLSMRFWSIGALDDELGHPADLDVSQIMALHHVGSDKRCTWIHSHGLAEIGAFDFDILDPSEDLVSSFVDLPRAIAFAILDGALTANAARFRLFAPEGDVRAVAIENFLATADPAVQALRLDADEEHNRDRSVLCEPVTGLLGRFRSRPRPSRLLSGPMDDGCMFGLSWSATELGAQRALGTYSQLRKFAAEFAELPTLVKLGYRVDDAVEDEREHMWFSVHEFGDDHVDATLESPPRAVSRLALKQRGEHPVELMSDWAIMTPIGMITPRSFAPVKQLREGLARAARKRGEH